MSSSATVHPCVLAIAYFALKRPVAASPPRLIQTSTVSRERIWSLNPVLLKRLAGWATAHMGSAGQ